MCRSNNNKSCANNNKKKKKKKNNCTIIHKTDRRGTETLDLTTK